MRGCTLGVKGCVSGHDIMVRLMPRTWAGGVKSEREHTASMQAHRQLPSKGDTSVLRFGYAQL